jgi:sec-independent protein translocase protein TatA
MELIVVLAIALLILGPKRLPGAARSVGTGMREFKDSLTGRDSNEALATTTPKAETAAANDA